MKQTSTLTRKLAQAQELSALVRRVQNNQAQENKSRSYSLGYGPSDRAINGFPESTPLSAVLYRLYTEDKDTLLALVRRYFPHGATLISALGVWDGGSELSKVIEVVGTIADLQRIFDLAGDIRVTNAQTSVLVMWQRVSRFDITEVSINEAEAAL